MLTYNITNWVEPLKKLKWLQALRIPTQNPNRWTRKAAEWNQGLIISTKTQRRAGRPAKRWEDDLSEFEKDAETEASQSEYLKNNNTWLITVKNIYEWEKKERRQTRYRRLRYQTQLPATTRQQQQKHHHTNNCNTTTKTQCSSVHHRQQQHHDEEPVLFIVVYGIMGEVLRVAYALRSIQYTRTNGPLTPYQCAKI